MDITVVLLVILAGIGLFLLLNGRGGTFVRRGNATRVIEREVVEPPTTSGADARVIERDVAEPTNQPNEKVVERVVEREVDDPNRL